MALGAPQQDLISDVGSVCNTLLGLQGIIEQIDILYNGAPDWDTLITDEEIDGVPSFAAIGLTAQDVADAIFQIKTVRTQVMTGNITAVVKLAQAV
jgi:hypothetical protein